MDPQRILGHPSVKSRGFLLFFSKIGDRVPPGRNGLQRVAEAHYETSPYPCFDFSSVGGAYYRCGGI